MNMNTINFTHLKGKNPAVCNEPRVDLIKGKVYNIEFTEGEQYVEVYNGEIYICCCNCERFTLLGEEQ